jgi:arabinofuranosyltransferase
MWGASVATLSLFFIHLDAYQFLNDDAFISFRYADQWARRGEVSYNTGERVEGYTNFLWVALLSGARWLGGDIPKWSLILGGLFGLSSLLITLGAPRFLWGPSPPDHPLERWTQGWIGATLLALSPSFCCWSSGGLEVQLFTATLTCGTLLTLSAWGRPLAPRASLAGAVLALAAMTRPEGVLFFGLLGLYRLGMHIGARRPPTPSDWRWGLSFATLYLPYYGWRWIYYGFPLPNTYYVKVGAPNFWTPGLRYLVSWWEAHPWLWLTLVLSALLIKHLRRNTAQGGRADSVPLAAIDSSEAPPSETPPSILVLNSPTLFGVTALFTLCLCLHVARVGGDFMALHRFMVPILPLLTLLTAVLTVYLFRMLPKSIHPRALSLCVLVLSVLTLGAHARTEHTRALKIGSEGGVDSIGWLKQFSVQCAHIGRWIHSNTPPDARLATTAAGTIAFYADRYTIDLLGLNDSWIAHNVPARGNRPGHTKSAPFRYPIDRGVTHLIYHPTLALKRPHPHHRYLKTLRPFGFRWETVHIPQMEPPWLGLWVRPPSRILDR